MEELEEGKVVLVMTRNEARLLNWVLECATYFQGNMGCNDFDLSKFMDSAQERQEFIELAYHGDSDREELGRVMKEGGYDSRYFLGNWLPAVAFQKMIQDSFPLNEKVELIDDAP